MDPEVTPLEKTIAAVGYLTLVGWVIAFTMNFEKRLPFAGGHLRQMFGLLIMMLITNVTEKYYSSILSLILYIICITFWALGLSAALRKKHYLVPGLGHYFDRWFTFI